MASRNKINRVDAFNSILSNTRAPATQGDVQKIPLDEIHLNPNQPRKYVDEAALEQLMISIKERGVLQPVLLREHKSGYELVAGERRYRAAKLAGLEVIPAVLHDLSDEESLEIALLENLSREDLNPVEETDGMLRLLSLKLNLSVEAVLSIIRAGHYKALGRTDTTGGNKEVLETVEVLFSRVGRFTTSSFYKHRLPILKLPKELLDAVRTGKIEYSKARLIAGVADEKLRNSLLQKAISNRLSREQLKEAIAVAQRQSQQADSTGIDLGSFKRKLTPKRVAELPSDKQERLEVLLAEIESLLST